MLLLELTFLLIALAVLSLVMWIVLPPPNRYFWLLSIGIGEWSLWFGGVAFLCSIAAIVLGIVAGGYVWIATLIVGLTAIAITLYPFFSVRALARKNKSSFSLRQYFDDWPARDYFAKRERAGVETRTFDIVDDTELKLDIYLPTAETTNRGASLVVVHGGSWKGGTRSDFPRWNRWLCEQGFTVFDIDYRLAQPNYQTAPADVKAAVRWVKANAAEFGIDAKRVAILGRSAGAHLALLAAYSADISKNEDVCAAVSLYGPVDLAWAYDIRGNSRVHNGPGSLEGFLGGAPTESEEMRARYNNASPIFYVSRNSPPTFMAHGGRDKLVYFKNMERLSKKLSAVNVPHKTILIPYAQHGFDFNFTGWGSQIISSALLKFLCTHTRPGENSSG